MKGSIKFSKKTQVTDNYRTLNRTKYNKTPKNAKEANKMMGINTKFSVTTQY